LAWTNLRTCARRAVPAQGDVADPETGKRMVAVGVDAFGKLDVLVSNAGGVVRITDSPAARARVGWRDG
jgi:NAD(P)-dependent dehydrogenase (short-subunit alcohol dehydrogenase family)